MRLFWLLLRHTVAFLASTAIIFSATYVFAAEQVVLKYRIFRQSLSVRELTTFAQTGKLSSALRVNLALARQDPQKIRQYLTATVTADPLLLDRVLNSPVGEVVLDEISKTIHTPSRQADRQALRAAIVLSARDRQLSLLEILQHYPTTVVEVDGDRLESAYNQLRRLQGILENIL
jgi:hypothetical protein